MIRRNLHLPVLCLFLFASTFHSEAGPRILVGSKTFTESVVLGEIATQLIRGVGYESEHRREFGGTRFLWNALVGGDIHVYPEYTGTISQEILAGRGVSNDLEEIRAALLEYGIYATRPLGFNNTYVLGMKEERAQAFGIRTISDLREHPELRFGFSNEFMDRADGWPSLRERYRLPHTNVRGLTHDLAYRGIERNNLDVIDLYATDAEIKYYGLRSLEDDQGHFPEYNALILFREELLEQAPDAVAALRRLEGRIAEEVMVGLNARAKLDRIPESQAASDFLASEFGIETETFEESTVQRLYRTTVDHCVLVIISLSAAIVIAIPLGVWAAKSAAVGQLILGAVGIIQTIPALAMLVFMMLLGLGIGTKPALAALFLYSLLPIVRNTYTGLRGIQPSLLESAEAMGLPPFARLRLVELPLAASSILAGIKTSAVINIGTATLGALIGAGGYGQPILTGIRLDDVGLILQGAVPAALMALGAQFLFEGIERLIIPRGLRLKRS